MDKDRVYLDYEQEYHEERKARYAAQSELVVSQARLSEAVKVLEPFARLGKEAEWLDRADDAHAWSFDHASLTWGDFRAALNFLATIGEET